MRSVSTQIRFLDQQVTLLDFLDHLIREYPSKTLVGIKRSYFSPKVKDAFNLGGGVDAVRGVYQSIRMAEVRKSYLSVSNSDF